MAQPVWVLSVDLQTKTATFQSGMADAAKAARGSFNDIKAGADEMGRATSGSMMEARHGVMLLGEEFGIHLPRALTSFLTSLGPVAGVMQAAFPFLAIIAGVTLLIEHLDKMKSAAQQVGEKAAAWSKLTSASEEYGDSLRVTNEHLKQTLSALNGGTTNNLALALKEAAVQADHLAAHLQEDLDKSLKLVEGQQVSLWSKLLNSEGSADVTDKLRSDFEKAKAVIEQGKESIRKASESGNKESVQAAETSARVNAQKELGSMIVWVGQQLDEAAVKQQKFNAASLAEKVGSADYTDQTQRIAILRGELSNLHEQYDSTTLAFSNEALKIKIAGVQDAKKQIIDIIGLVGPYTAMREKMVKADEKADEDLMRMQSDVTRLFARELEEQNKLQEEAGKERAAHGMKMAELQAAADREAGQMRKSLTRMSAAEILDMELGFAAQEYSAKQQALQAELAAIAESDKDKENKRLVLNNKLLELDKQYQVQTQSLEEQSRLKQLASLQAAENRMKAEYARGFSEVIMRKESFGKMAQQIDSQIATGMLQNAIMSMMTLDMTKEKEAAAAARKGFLWGWEHGGPAAPILAPALGAMAFAAEMAFAEGGIVPGVGVGDIVPAMLTPGEAVLPKALTESLTNRAKFGDSGNGGGDVHVHLHSSPTIHAIDGASVQGMLDQHGEKFIRHATNHLRKMNR